LLRVQLENPFCEVSHFLVGQRLIPVLAELPPAVQAEERVGQPSVYGKGFDVFSELGMLLPELLFQRLECSDPLAAVLDQETAELFTTLATSRLAAAR